MSFLSVTQLRSLFDSLCTEYEYLSDNRTKLEQDCAKLREYIDAQVTQIQSLNQDFEKLRQDFIQRGGELPSRLPQGNQTFNQFPAEEQPQEKQEEQPEQDWELTTIVPVERIPHPVVIALLAEIVDVTVICSTAFSPDGTCLAIGSDKTLRVYNIDNDNFLFQHTIETEEEGTSNHVRSITWTADNQQLICGGEDGHIRVFRVPDGAVLKDFLAGPGEVFQVQMFNNGDYFAAVTGNGNLNIYSISDYSLCSELVRDVDNPVVATSLAISADDKTIAVGYSDCIVILWDTETKQALTEQTCHTNGVYAVKFLPVPAGQPQTRFVTASLDTTVKIWDIKTEEKGKLSLELWKSLDGHSNFVLSLAIDPKGYWLLSGSKDLTARLSSVQTGEMIYSIKAHTNSVISVAFNPLGNMFCTGSGDCSVKIWSISPEEVEEAA